MARSLFPKIQEANATLITSGHVEAVAEFFTPDYVAHATDRTMEGHAWIRKFLKVLRGAFPDIQIEVELLVEKKDRVAWQRRLRGTQHGDYRGFPACGRRIVWRDMVTSRFRDGRIAEDWVISDLAERLLLARKR
jgi:steroid delta-isomerase-like uncharacterized protein